jgi:ribosomal protein L21E
MEKQREYEIEPITDEELEELEKSFRKRKSGFYAEIEKQLEKSGLVKITVDRRTVAGGIWNYFSKQKGYVVKQIKKSDSEIIVIIMTKEKQQELEKKKQVKKQ